MTIGCSHEHDHTEVLKYCSGTANLSADEGRPVVNALAQSWPDIVAASRDAARPSSTQEPFEFDEDE